MSEHLIWQVGNRNPSIAENLLNEDETVVDLTGKTVKFKMRPVNSSTLKVDAAAVIVGAATDGNVRYDWATADVDTEGFFLVWWEVTTTSGGRTQDMMEAVIEFRAHAPELNGYVELEVLKSTLQMTGETFADQDLQTAIVAASRGIDEVTGRRFYADTDANQVRYYTPTQTGILEVDDLLTLTALETTSTGGTAFPDAWTQHTDYVLEPLNAAADGIPYTTVRLLSTRVNNFVYGWPRSVRVTGKFGWAAPPAAIEAACKLIATKIMKRNREAPFGVIQVGLEGEALRIARFDPDVQFLLAPYTRTQALIA